MSNLAGYVDFHIHAIGIEELVSKNPNLLRCIKDVFYLRTRPQPLTVLIKQMEQANVEKGILYSIDAKRVHNCEMPGNDLIYELVKEHQDLFMGIGSIDPLSENALSELEKLYSKYEFLGVFLSPAYQEFNPLDSRLFKVYELLEDSRMLLVFHTGLPWNNKLPMKWSNPLIVDDIARKYNKLIIVLTHMGWPWLDDLYAVMFRNRNVYAITSGVYTGSPFEHMRTILVEGYRKRVTERFLSERLLFGSEFPRMEIWKMVDAIERLEIASDVKMNILRNNALRLIRSLGR